jgi:hypothetical protein
MKNEVYESDANILMVPKYCTNGSIEQNFKYWQPCFCAAAESKELEMPNDSFLLNASKSLQMIVESDNFSSDIRFMARLYQHAFVINGVDQEWESLESWNDIILYQLLEISIPLIEELLPVQFKYETQTMLENLSKWLNSSLQYDLKEDNNSSSISEYDFKF